MKPKPVKTIPNGFKIETVERNGMRMRRRSLRPSRTKVKLFAATSATNLPVAAVHSRRRPRWESGSEERNGGFQPPRRCVWLRDPPAPHHPPAASHHTRHLAAGVAVAAQPDATQRQGEGSAAPPTTHAPVPSPTVLNPAPAPAPAPLVSSWLGWIELPSPPSPTATHRPPTYRSS